MTITRDIARDLLPAYLSGEVRPDTRAAVEAYLAQDPEFAREVAQEAEALERLQSMTSDGPDAALRLRALEGAKRLLRAQRIVFAVASTLTLNALSLGFSFQVDGGSVRVRWLALPGQGLLLIAIAVVAAAMWIVYALFRRRVATRVIG